MKDWKPYKCWCGVTFEFPMDEEFHDCNNWEHVLQDENPLGILTESKKGKS